VKKYIFILALVFFTGILCAQENMFSIGGGYSFANIKESDEKGTGYNINATFEFNPTGKFIHGISFGYIGLKASETLGLVETKYTVNSFPVYYAPKYFLGESKIKIFIKGALGMQYADLRKEAIISESTIDFGFFTGGGAGINLSLSEKLFINAEYDINWVTNSAYNDGWINSASGAIGFRF
jgi:hypothetical protein